MSVEDLVDHVAAHAGVPPAMAEHALRAVLCRLGATLPSSARAFVAAELPDTLATSLAHGDSIAQPLEAAVMQPGMTLGHAREHVASCATC
jgi:uncharacterized protein (DUF2267 family)